MIFCEEAAWRVGVTVPHDLERPGLVALHAGGLGVEWWPHADSAACFQHLLCEVINVVVCQLRCFRSGGLRLVRSTRLRNPSRRGDNLEGVSGRGPCSALASADGAVIQVLISSGVVRNTGIAFGWIAPASALGSVVRNAWRSLVVSLLAFRTEVQFVEMPRSRRVAGNRRERSRGDRLRPC